MYRILIVEDEQAMLTGLRDNLEFEGYRVDIADDGKAGLEMILNDEHDLILLDVMLPSMSGFDVCRQARAKGIQTPIMLLTAKGEEIDKVLGLELGADDYVTKPFSLRELLARIKAILRRAPKAGSSLDNKNTTIGKLEVSFPNYEAFKEGKSIKMSHKEYEFLHYLWEHPNKVISRDELLDNVWGIDYMPSSRTVDNFILKLRQLIEEDSNNPRMIITVHGVGYKLIK